MDPTCWKLLTAAPMPAVVQDAFVTDGHLDEIASRADLDKAVWWRLARSRPKLNSSTMAVLCRRELDDEQIAWVFANERRTGALESLISRNRDRITPEHIAAAPKLPAGAAAVLSSLGQLSEDLQLSLAARAGKGAPAIMLARGIQPGVLDERVLPVMLAADTWWPTRPDRRVNAATALLIELSESVIDGLLADTAAIPRVLVTALAGSHQLQGPGIARLADRIAGIPGTEDGIVYAAMAFAANPKVPVELAQSVVDAHMLAGNTLNNRRARHGTRHLGTQVSQCQDVDLLQWVAYRALPSQYRPAGKPCYVPAIVAAPAYPELGDRIRQQIEDWDVPLPTAFAQEVAAALGTEFDPSAVLLDNTPATYLDPAVPDAPSGGDHLVDLDTVSVRSLTARVPRQSTALVLDAISQHLGDDPSAWRTFLSFVTDSAMSVGEVLALVDATQ